MTLKNVYPVKFKDDKLFVEDFERISPWWKFDNKFELECLARIVRQAVSKPRSFVHDGWSIPLESNEYVYGRSATSWQLNNGYRSLIEKGHLKVRRLLGRTIFELPHWEQITSDYPKKLPAGRRPQLKVGERDAVR